MNYSFDVEHAKKYGLEEAIMLQNLLMMGDGDKNFSKQSLTLLFPFWTEKQIENIIKSLQKQGELKWK